MRRLADRLEALRQLGGDARRAAAEADADEAGEHLGQVGDLDLEEPEPADGVVGEHGVHDRQHAEHEPADERAADGADAADDGEGGDREVGLEPRASVVSVWPDTAPARPAMPADSANTATLVRVRSRPRVAHAAGLSFIADRRRPHAPRRSATRPMPTNPNASGQHDDLPECDERHLERAELQRRHLPVVAGHDRRLE